MIYNTIKLLYFNSINILEPRALAIQKMKKDIVEEYIIFPSVHKEV